jgi:nicotinate phosphoribosyltransferase
VEVLAAGRQVMETPKLDQIRHQRRADVERLDPGVRRLMNPHIYHVSLTQSLWDLKGQLLRQLEA